jgi:DNA-binding response OmpR family regulator
VTVYAPGYGIGEEGVARCRILVVEDEAMIAMLVEDMVLDFGSEVVGPAGKMDEALRLASHAPLDAAILDVNVGGAVVFPVADVLQDRGIPFIFASGYGSGGLPPRFRNRPALAKPFSYQELAEVLRAVLAEQPCHMEQAA